MTFKNQPEWSLTLRRRTSGVRSAGTRASSRLNAMATGLWGICASSTEAEEDCDKTRAARGRPVRMHVVAMVLLLPAVMSLEKGWRSSCGLTNISITVESEECGSCITIETTACAGGCWTEDQVYRSPTGLYHQKTCNFHDLTYKSLELKGCPAGAEVHFLYPVALSCECSKCNTDMTDCSHLSQHTSSCSTHY
ncbi:hypothetical protein DNTS_011046 [Danionella cerebrum]|uniref:Glycoprotein hormone subunit beta domain-containing protein n=1 Tax=Danionella cerebrum TaxID=2873325 RepID=A0A553MTY7_9TELE|nr:hypothetical protein DNTS_011046 [Danionella translucida]